MNTASVRPPRSALSLLSLVVAGAAATIAGVAIATDDVSGRPSQIVVTPLDENHPATAPDNARLGPLADDRPPFTPFRPQSGESASNHDCLDRPLPRTDSAKC